MTQINEADELVEDKYCVSIKSKIRYINPLVRSENNDYIRINKICLNYTTKKYAYFDFNF